MHWLIFHFVFFSDVRHNFKCLIASQGCIMPKEQPCMNEASLSASSTKNAKDKSNSTAMQAVHDSEHTDHSGGRGSRCSSEKDSGFSGESNSCCNIKY